MTSREVAILACRIIAVVAVVKGIEFLVWLAPIWPSGAVMWGFLLSFAMGPLLLLLAAAFLWRKAGVIAAWITGYEIQDEQYEPDVLRIDATFDDLLVVAIALLGIWVLINSIPELVSLLVIATLILAPGAGELERSIADRIISSDVIAGLIKVALGIWLLFGARGIADWLKRVKNIGLESPDDQDSSSGSPPPRNDD